MTCIHLPNAVPQARTARYASALSSPLWHDNPATGHYSQTTKRGTACQQTWMCVESNGEEERKNGENLPYLYFLSKCYIVAPGADPVTKRSVSSVGIRKQPRVSEAARRICYRRGRRLRAGMRACTLTRLFVVTRAACSGWAEQYLSASCRAASA